MAKNKKSSSNATAKQALTLLQDSKFNEAKETAISVLKNDKNDSLANAIAAVTLYKETIHTFIFDLGVILEGADNVHEINKRYLRWTLKETEKGLAKVDKYLEYAAKDKNFSMELCLAKWKVDWNRNGEIDERDEAMMQVEYDVNGEMIPKDDKRRTPTFRFDYGDIYWARAMLSFQRAAIDFILAYKYPSLAEFEQFFKEPDNKLIFKVKDKKLLLKSRDLILKGLEYADKSRVEYLAEKDDEREWLPNPKQKSHPLPLPVDAQLYETWANVLNDLQLLMKGNEGISVKEVAQLGDNQWENPPDGYINIANIFEKPSDIVLDASKLSKIIRDYSGESNKLLIEAVLKDIFGNAYVKTMKNTGLFKQAKRIKGELERGGESFERKLRYLIWLN